MRQDREHHIFYGGYLFWLSQFTGIYTGIFADLFYDLRVEDLSGMTGHGYANAILVFENLVTPALPDTGKTPFFQH